MGDLAYSLQRQLGRPVVDKTGHTGEFDFGLKRTADPMPDDAALDSSEGSVFSALWEPGLRLVSMRGPAEVVVIEGIERASENRRGTLVRSRETPSTETWPESYSCRRAASGSIRDARLAGA